MERTILCSIIMRLATYKATRITDVIIIAVLCLYIDVGCLSCQQVLLLFPRTFDLCPHVWVCDFFTRFFGVFFHLSVNIYTVQFSSFEHFLHFDWFFFFVFSFLSKLCKCVTLSLIENIQIMTSELCFYNEVKSTKKKKHAHTHIEWDTRRRSTQNCRRLIELSSHLLHKLWQFQKKRKKK